jgi:hypothetical protein
MKILKSLAVAVLAFPIVVMACSFDTDCNPGSRCVKASGSIYGVCEGGISPGNSNDRQPVQAHLILTARMATPVHLTPIAAPVLSA